MSQIKTVKNYHDRARQFTQPQLQFVARQRRHLQHRYLKLADLRAVLQGVGPGRMGGTLAGDNPAAARRRRWIVPSWSSTDGLWNRSE
jgi:hypothetical protein